jgi:hypothetical protein
MPHSSVTYCRALDSEQFCDGCHWEKELVLVFRQFDKIIFSIKGCGAITNCFDEHRPRGGSPLKQPLLFGANPCFDSGLFWSSIDTLSFPIAVRQIAVPVNAGLDSLFSTD